MLDLVAQSPVAALLPIAMEGAHLAEIPVGAMTLVAPFAGEAEAVSAALTEAIGIGLPAPGEMQSSEKGRTIWFGVGKTLVIGTTVALEGAALTDQSDAWIALTLEGRCCEDVLARLCPVDLRSRAFPVNRCARTLLHHIPVLVGRTGRDAFQLLVPRSMAADAVTGLARVMRRIAARGDVG